jgi:predicted amidophosphoribosyltransferase
MGDPVFNISGFDWPEKLKLSGESRVCIVCGNTLDIDAAVCPRCRAPVPDHTTLLRELG